MAFGAFQFTAAVQLVLVEVIVISVGILVKAGALLSNKFIVWRHEADNEVLLGSVAVQVLCISVAPAQLPVLTMASLKIKIGFPHPPPAVAEANPEIEGVGTLPSGQAA